MLCTCILIITPIRASIVDIRYLTISLNMSQITPPNVDVPFGYTLVTTHDGRKCLIPDAMIPAGEMALKIEQQKKAMAVEEAAGGVSRFPETCCNANGIHFADDLYVPIYCVCRYALCADMLCADILCVPICSVCRYVVRADMLYVPICCMCRNLVCADMLCVLLSSVCRWLYALSAADVDVPMCVLSGCQSYLYAATSSH